MGIVTASEQQIESIPAEQEWNSGMFDEINSVFLPVVSARVQLPTKVMLAGF